MDTETFQRAANLAPALAERWILPITEAAHEFDINTPARLAAWIAQMGHESGGFRLLSESFNYAPDALKIFSRIPASARAQLGRQPGEKAVSIARQQQIANLAYGGRFGNGDAASGDGWRYRGRGLKQVTFKDNYRDAGRALSVDLLNHPDQLATDDRLAARSAGWFWKSRGCNEAADRRDFDACTRAINPAMDGKSGRDSRYRVCCDVLLV
ncbi:glycoside hydrolase family protein [Caballeronia arationis]|jgi:putative chitinase|uniref:Putative chitinase n=1 Tax=Caballeronia arationis TaxID=1777142 RepID=A0A7Z7N7P4_9BURK|nr:glycoside hydrolase family 19 protein [Caballeronia arationis]SAK95133.1 glycoside hydrolase family protein [Caballeronia arationis]SOE89236.1 putative chitinase [Caballeronia arationis]